MAPSAGPMAEFAKMPTTTKAAVFAIAGALFGLIYWQFGFKSLDQSLDDARNERDAKVAQNKKLADDIPKYTQLKAQMKELKQKIDENQKALPTETELPAFFETINRKVIESGVEMIRSDKKQEESLEGFVKVPIQIEITGTFLQIKRFFASLSQKDMGAVHVKDDNGVEERERIISIENLTLAQPVIKNRDIVLDATFVAATFRQEDQAGSGSGSGSGAPGTVAPPPPTVPKPPTSAPLPSATTPAGAKARVENALDKGDERNRNGGGANEAKTPAGSGSDRLKGGM